MHLNKPTPILLLLWPTCWALLLSSININLNNNLNYKTWLIFLFGIVISRTLGCVINDLFDKKIDKAKPIRADFSGLEVPNAYVYGFGLDFKGIGRNIPHLYVHK